jgi:hypothetical protein
LESSSIRGLSVKDIYWLISGLSIQDLDALAPGCGWRAILVSQTI